MEIRNKSGIFFSIDALIALIIILSAVLLLKIPHTEQIDESNLDSDLMVALSSISISEINNTYVKALISQGIINETNTSVLEEIGNIYIKDEEQAKNIAQEIIKDINTSENIGIWFEDNLIASKNSTPYENSKEIQVSRQLISGIAKDSISKGYVAKSWLKKIEKKETLTITKGELICGGWKTYSWGDYCGYNLINIINYSIEIPSNAKIISASWLSEPSWVGQNTTLYVNDNQIFSGKINKFANINITSYLNPGENTATLYSPQGGDDGASHIVVEYETPDIQSLSLENKYHFFETSSVGVLYHEKSIFVPENINSMEIKLNVTRKVSLEIRKGSQTIPIGQKTVQNGYAPQGEEIIFTNSEIESALSSNGLSYQDLNNEYFTVIVKIGSSGETAEIKENSFVSIESAQVDVPFGSIDITQEIPLIDYSNEISSGFYRDLQWAFYLPKNSIPLIADWQLGWFSQGQSDQKASANSIILHQHPPDEFIEAFNRFGYTNKKSEGVFIEGENNFTLSFGENYGISNEASYGHLTYFIKSFVSYGDTKEKAQGGTKTIEFEDGVSREITIGNSQDPWDPEKDAIDDAVERLLSQLDSDGNGKVDLIVNEDSFEIDTLDISGVPFLWSTEVQVRTWK